MKECKPQKEPLHVPKECTPCLPGLRNRRRMTHDENPRFFSEEDVKKAFQFPDWPAGTEVVCYCRSTDSRDAIEQIVQRGGWKIVKYAHIDELPMAQFYKPGQVIFVKREAVEWKREPTPMELATWRGQMLGGLHPSDWENSKKDNLKEIQNNENDLHDCSRCAPGTRLESRD